MIIVYLKIRITTFKGIDKTSSANQALFKWYTIEMPCIYSYVMCCNSSHQYTCIQLCDVFVFQLTSVYSYVMCCISAHQYIQLCDVDATCCVLHLYWYIRSRLQSGWLFLDVYTYNHYRSVSLQFYNL